MANGFTFGGYHSDQFSILMNEKRIPILPPTKEHFETIPGKDGVWDFGTQYEKRPIEIDCTVLAADKADLKTKVRDLAGVLNPREGAKELIFDDEPDKLYYARFSGQLPLDQIGAFGTFTLTLVCPDPFVYSASEEVRSGSDTIWATNNGTFVARPVLEITTNGGDGSVTVTHPDSSTQTLTFESSAPSGVYVVNCKEMTITKDGTAAYQYLSGDFFELHPGTNKIAITGTNITDVQVTFRHTWL